MKTLNQVIDKYETCSKPDSDCENCPYVNERCLCDKDALHYLKEYAEKKDELEEAIQKEKIEFLKAAEVVRICMENLNGYSNYASVYNTMPRTVKVTDYTENVKAYEAEVGGKCECGNWVYDELPYCPHCGKRLYWGE